MQNRIEACIQVDNSHSTTHLGGRIHIMTLRISEQAVAFAVGKYRFLFTVATIASVRIAIALVLFASISATGGFKVPFMEAHWTVPQLNFLYLFSAWDTGWYLFVAQNWYPPFLHPSWHFFPLYPSIIRVLAWVGVETFFGCMVDLNSYGATLHRCVPEGCRELFPKNTSLCYHNIVFFVSPRSALFRRELHRTVVSPILTSSLALPQPGIRTDCCPHGLLEHSHEALRNLRGVSASRTII